MKVKMRLGDEPKPKPTKQQLEAANQFAKDFMRRRGLTSLIRAEDVHVGDSIPQFVDERGRPATAASSIPTSRISNKVPSYITKLDWDSKENLPYYIDDKTGYIQYVDKSLFHSPRFNPTRGQTSLIAKLK